MDKLSGTQAIRSWSKRASTLPGISIRYAHQLDERGHNLQLVEGSGLPGTETMESTVGCRRQLVL